MVVNGQVLAIAKTTLGIKIRKEDGEEVWMTCVGDPAKKYSPVAIVNFIKNSYEPNSPISLNVETIEGGKLVIKSVNPKRANSLSTDTKNKEKNDISCEEDGLQTVIKSRVIGKMTAETVSGILQNLAGQLSPNEILEITKTYINEIYNIYNSLIK